MRAGDECPGLNNATLPFVIELADYGLEALSRNPHLHAGINVHQGRIVHEAVAMSLGFSTHSPLRLEFWRAG